MELDVVICGDCLDILAKMPDESVDLVVTDPPYSLNFMGLKWDKALPSVDVWRECLRVLKPGAFAFVMCIPRQDCLSRMVINLEDAGFDVSFSSLVHCFATGFPKAANLSKLADKLGGNKLDKEWLRFREWLRKRLELSGIKQSVINEACGNQMAGHYFGESQPTIPTVQNYEIIKDILNLPDEWDIWISERNPMYEEAEREATGKGLAGLGKNKPAHDGGFKANYDLKPIPATPEAKALEGSYAGYQPKPAMEFIITVMRPLAEKTYLDQALANGHGCTWLDSGRIPFQEHGEDPRHGGKGSWKPKRIPDGHTVSPKAIEFQSSPRGRFAPNLLCSDDVLNDGVVSAGSHKQVPTDSSNPAFGGGLNNGIGYNDSGSFSRHFSLDAWSEANLPESVNRTFPFLIVPKSSRAEKQNGLEEGYQLKEDTPPDVVSEIEACLLKP